MTGRHDDAGQGTVLVGLDGEIGLVGFNLQDSWPAGKRISLAEQPFNDGALLPWSTPVGAW